MSAVHSLSLIGLNSKLSGHTGPWQSIISLSDSQPGAYCSQRIAPCGRNELPCMPRPLYFFPLMVRKSWFEFVSNFFTKIGTPSARRKTLHLSRWPRLLWLLLRLKFPTQFGASGASQRSEVKRQSPEMSHNPVHGGVVVLVVVVVVSNLYTSYSKGSCSGYDWCGSYAKRYVLPLRHLPGKAAGGTTWVHRVQWVKHGETVKYVNILCMFGFGSYFASNRSGANGSFFSPFGGEN